MTIGKQIAVCVGGMIASCAVVGICGWVYVSALAGRLDESITVSGKKVELVGQLKVNVFTFRLQERGMLLFSYIKADQQVIACRDAYDKATNAALEKIGTIRALIHTNQGGELIDQAEAGIKDYAANQLEVRKLLAAGDVAQATEFDKKMLVPAGGKIVAALDQFTEVMSSINQKANEEADGMRGTAHMVLAFGLLACALTGLIVAFTMRRITVKLQATTAELKQAAGEVASAAAQVALSSQSLAQGSSEQAAALEETSASTEEINAMARQNSDNSRSAAALVTSSGQKFTETNQSLEEMVTAMHEISTESGKISKIIKVIDGIAFQTNILALNAAVEAARAGEAGMGFAVVADEVRNLAQRCTQAARDTSELIEESINKSHSGQKKVDRVADAIRRITEEAARVKVLVDEVNGGSEEQVRGIEQVGKAIAQMGSVTQVNAASAEESASAAEQLTAQSEALNGIVKGLTEMVG
jgi:methyl-accepting chemotaxis protein